MNKSRHTTGTTGLPAFLQTVQCSNHWAWKCETVTVVYSIQYTVCSIQYTVYCTQYTVYCIQYTVYCRTFMTTKTALIYRFDLHCRWWGLSVLLDCLWKNYDVYFIWRGDDVTKIFIWWIRPEAIVVGADINSKMGEIILRNISLFCELTNLLWGLT